MSVDLEKTMSSDVGLREKLQTVIGTLAKFFGFSEGFLVLWEKRDGSFPKLSEYQKLGPSNELQRRVVAARPAIDDPRFRSPVPIDWSRESPLMVLVR